MNNILRIFALVFSVAITTQGSANDGVNELKQLLSKQMPKVETRVDVTPIDGLYRVLIGRQVIYMTKDARYMMDGKLVDRTTNKNYSEEPFLELRLSLLEQLGEENMVVYKPDTVKHTITVLTDIYCKYCRDLHSEMDQYLENGIKVRYVFLPLKGKVSYDASVTVWCSENRNEALDLAKAGKKLEAKDCDNPIDEHQKVSLSLGPRGTPAIILQDGSMLPGFVPAKKLVNELDRMNVSTAKTGN